ncbi:hypothetical protein [Legionella micdadei]|uniref:Putative membrane protein n=1 Tax=Legionella micdadei TaxID=451 RepID=A0A098GL81_LEGMI|nr:hypothetical protein [Legionella micdadei]ARG98663.1 hypothetical protein B6N58_13905 [Legionella micdadei]ARH01376.1 hypothetical protein B6V88_13760 [Legionella micdadei]KTD28871.1 hypothetical protein Lmic_0791 [Legionella micdadei]NSL17083.1 hypothetical protein [Legionella micdadei]CEG62251.1 putative membrane protein [Legionella micdadei]
MNDDQTVSEKVCASSPFHRISWAAIFAGAFVGIGLGFLLRLLGVAIGLSAYSSSPSGIIVIAIGGLIGLLIGSIISMGAAGFVAGYLGRSTCPHHRMGIIYGFTTWSVVLLFTALIAIPEAHYINLYKSSLVQNTKVVATKSQTETASPGNATTQPAANPSMPANQAVAVTPMEVSSMAWIVFILFFIGALSACIGACWALCQCKKTE